MAIVRSYTGLLSFRASMDPGMLRRRNEDLTIREIANRQDHVNGYPFEIQFSGEHRCNLRCVQCGATIERNQGLTPLMDQRLPLRSLERFEKLRPQIPFWNWLSLTGSGETLINPDLPRILEILTDTDHDCAVAFNTNGTLWTRERAQMIVDAKVDEIRFSMDGATAATFERIRVNAKFEKVLDGIRTLRSVRDAAGATRPKIAFSCNFMRQNIEELPMLVELAHEMGAVDLIANNTIVYAPEMEGEALSGHQPLVARMLREAQRRAADLGVRLINNLLDDAEIERHLGAEPEPPPRLRDTAQGNTTQTASPPAPAAPVSPAKATEPAHNGHTASAPADRGAAVSEREAADCSIARGEAKHDEVKHVDELVLPPLEGLPPDLPEIVQACQRPWTGLYVENNGYVKVCCFDVDPIGNLDDQSFDEIWNGPLARELRRSFLEDRPPEGCRNCFIFASRRASEDVFVRPSGAVRSHIDAPGLDPRVSGSTTVHGWALDRAGVERVELFIDGALHAVTTYGHERPDVEATFPGYPDGSACGFQHDLDTTALSVGEHVLAISVHNREGQVSEGPKRAILVAR